MEARELGPLLSRLAESIRGDVRMRLRVEVGRARIRTSARIVTLTTIVTIMFMFLFSRDLLSAYDTLGGQLWLIVVGGIFAMGGWLLRRYGEIEMPDRFTARRIRREVPSP
jgi:Flp pilus assembly protein TadB